jgi:hypothetical protein
MAVATMVMKSGQMEQQEVQHVSVYRGELGQKVVIETVWKMW